MSRFTTFSIALLTTGLLVLSGAARAAEPVAVVNGQPISQDTYEKYLKFRSQQQNGQGGQVSRQALINELVNRELLLQEAKKKGLAKDPEVAFQIEQLKNDVLIQAVISKEVKDHPVTDKELKKTYDDNIASVNAKEYKASHILLKTEDDAKAVIKELDNGAVFADVAKAKSTGPTAKKGGDLGWFNPQQMVPPFAEAVQKMKKGTYTKTPVKTQFGWHVIKLEDERKITPPKFEDVKDRLRQVKSSQQVQQFIMQLRNNAKVEIK
ncbi:MAG: peptidylprolyl isomerase [Thiohalophilus sp.]|jgi:peptidyl-prolyl cis-trans isomerase C